MVYLLVAIVNLLKTKPPFYGGHVNAWSCLKSWHGNQLKQLSAPDVINASVPDYQVFGAGTELIMLAETWLLIALL